MSRTSHPNLGLDFATTRGWSISERGLIASVVPVWAGVREYGGQREFRDPDQLKRRGFLSTLERLPAVIQHPVDDKGRLMYLSARASSALGDPIEWASSEGVFVPHAQLQVGHGGDLIEWVMSPDDVEVPSIKMSITAPSAIATITGLGGREPAPEVSLGFIKHVIQEPGVWISPRGEAIAYDARQILDPDDPSVPDDLRPWVGANYLGVGFPAGASRGVYTRFGIDAKHKDVEGYDVGTRPRTFFLVRQNDESGVSGVGHVLDGIIWPDGQVNTRWRVPEKPAETNVADSYEAWKQIHVSNHPDNKSLVVFDDGGEEPIRTEEDDMEENDKKKIEALEAEIASLKEKLSSASADKEDPEEEAGADEENPEDDKDKEAGADEMTKLKARVDALEADKAKLKASADAKDATIAKLHGQLEPVRKAELEAKIKEVALRAGVDAKHLVGVDAADLPVVAMKQRFALGVDSPPEKEYLDNKVYLRARYDALPQHAPQAASEKPSKAFLRAVGADAPSANTPASIDEDPLSNLP